MIKTAMLSGVKAGTDDSLEDGTFTAYASVFDVKDSYGDVVRKGAFADTLAAWAKSDNLIPLLFGHNMEDPDYNIGYIEEAKEDDHGLFVKGVIDLDSPKGRQVYKLIKGRRLSQLSFAYDILEGAWVDKAESKSANEDDLGSYYELRKMKLHEVSLVTVGANSETEVLSVKHAADLLKAGRTVSAENEAMLRDAVNTILSVLPPEGDSSSETDASEAEPSSDPVEASTGEKAMQNSSVEDYAYFVKVASL